MTKKKSNLTRAVGGYIKAKANWTKCKGRHMRQVCHRCRLYRGGKCTVYKEYVDAWTLLQASYKKEML